MQLLYRKK